MKKKLMSAVLALALTVCMAMPVVAAPINDADSHDQTVEVTATLETGYVVSLPARIQLVGNNNVFEADYDVQVSGNLPKTEYVEVTPASTFDLVNIADSTKKAPTTVTQKVTKWSSGNSVFGAVKLGTKTQGHISAEIKDDGTYKGDFAFTYQKH